MPFSDVTDGINFREEYDQLYKLFHDIKTIEAKFFFRCNGALKDIHVGISGDSF